MDEVLTLQEYESITFQAADDFNRQDYEQALEKFLKMEKSNPRNIKIHEVLAYVYLRLNQLDEAHEQYRKCRELLAEHNPLVTADEGRTFDDLVEEAGSKKTVEKEYQKVMRARKSDNILRSFDIPAKLAILYMAEGKYDKAEEILLKFRDKAVKEMEKKQSVREKERDVRLKKAS